MNPLADDFYSKGGSKCTKVGDHAWWDQYVTGEILVTDFEFLGEFTPSTLLTTQTVDQLDGSLEL